MDFSTLAAAERSRCSAEAEMNLARAKELEAKAVLWSELAKLVRFAEKFLCVVAKEKGVEL